MIMPYIISWNSRKIKKNLKQMLSKRFKLYRKWSFFDSLLSSTSGSVFDCSASLFWRFANPSMMLVPFSVIFVMFIRRLSLSTEKHSFLLFFKIFTNRFGQKSSMSFSSHLWKREILHTAKNVIKTLHKSCMSRKIL